VTLPGRVLLLFVDGIGLGDDDPVVNPFAAARLPTMSRLLQGRRLLRDSVAVDGRLVTPCATLVAADATLGVPGRPQSGTGQTALLTGVNAPARFGRHFGSWVPTGLREMLERDNLLARAARAGRTVAFANAGPPAERLRRRPAAPPLAARGAGLAVRGADALRTGAAVASSITNHMWNRHVPEAGVPQVSAREAGVNLARIAAESQLTLFAHYDTDLVGHARSLADGVRVLERLDAFVGGLLTWLPDDTLVVMASDHGNLEDVATGHTLNPVPVLAWGPGHRQAIDGVRAITDVAPRILHLLSIDPTNEPS
jgi:2,3-bisphosphoglycerate-independent phosphoglycerate mutase